MAIPHLPMSELTNAFMEIEILLNKIDRKAKEIIDKNWLAEYSNSFCELQTIIDTQLQMSIHRDIDSL